MPRTDRASRVIDAPAERIFAAFVDPDELVRWLPPAGMTARVERFDPRPGGSSRIVLTHPDGGDGKSTADADVVESRFVEVVAGERLVQDVDFVSDDPAFAGTMRMTWRLTPADAQRGRTLVEFVADDVPEGIAAEDHAAGLQSSLTNLARHVAPQPTPPRTYGMGRGEVFPAASATSLLNPLRRLVQSPSRTVKAMEAAPADRILEVGCGPGFFTPDLTKAVPNGSVVALDLQGEMLSMARPRAVAARFVQGDAAVLPFASGAFDGVLVATVLGEVPDRAACLRELRRVLRRGGLLSVAETRRDSDFVRFDTLRAEVESSGFLFQGRRGPRWQYVARFQAT